MADYVFYRTFDVGKYIISEKFPSSIGGVEVDHFFNRRTDTKPSVYAEHKGHSKNRSEVIPIRAIKNDPSAKEEKGFNVPATSTGGQMKNSMKDGPYAGVGAKRSEQSLSASPSDAGSVQKRKLLSSIAEGPRDDIQPYRPSKVSGHDKRVSDKDSCREKKDSSSRVSLDDKPRMFTDKGAGNKQHITRYKYTEVTRKPGMDSTKWLKLEVWEEERLHEANEKGTLLLLENLDPSFTSAEVEDIVWHVFEQKIKAKMIQHTAFSSPHSGQAFAIFKTKEAADDVISQLINGCLILGDGRPIVGRRRLPRKFALSGEFVGHLRIDRTRPERQREEIRNAVSTSHFSQPNTIEYEMAIQWCALEEKSNLWWKALHEERGKEIEALMKQMRIHHQLE